MKNVVDDDDEDDDDYEDDYNAGVFVSGSWRSKKSGCADSCTKDCSQNNAEARTMLQSSSAPSGTRPTTGKKTLLHLSQTPQRFVVLNRTTSVMTKTESSRSTEYSFWHTLTHSHTPHTTYICYKKYSRQVTFRILIVRYYTKNNL